MAPQVFGIEHLLYLAVFIIITILSLVFSKKLLKTQNGQTIYLKTLALLTFVSVVVSRILMGIHFGWIYVIPSSFCAMTSLLFSIAVFFGKPNSKIYHGLWYLSFAGCIATLIYPDFISQGSTIFYPLTISSFLHHSFSLLLSLQMLSFDWFKFDLKEIYVLPLCIALYIVFGYFEVLVLSVDTSMCVNKPLLSGTPIDCYFILGVGTVLAIIVNLIINLINKLKSKK